MADVRPAQLRPVYLTVGEAAEALRISPRHLRDLIAADAVPAVHLGRRVLLPRIWLDGHAERCVSEWAARHEGRP